MVVVTHEIGFAARGRRPRRSFMDHGRIVEQGPPAAILDDPQHERTRDFLQRVLHPVA